MEEGCSCIIQDNKRKRRCQYCTSRHVLKSRKNDPIKTLHHKFYNCIKRRWPDANSDVYSMTIVKYVYDKWKGVSAISGETNYHLLCIFPIYPSKNNPIPPTKDELVLITSQEAMSIARSPVEKQPLKYPEHVRNVLFPFIFI